MELVLIALAALLLSASVAWLFGIYTRPEMLLHFLMLSTC
jgi:hypothetical protein